MTEGCPECGWNGDVAVTHDRTHRYYTHIIVKGGETFTGTTCSERTEPKHGLVSRVARAMRGER